MSVVLDRAVEDVLEWVDADGCTDLWAPDPAAIEYALRNGLIVKGSRQSFDLTGDGELERQALQ